MKNLVLLLIFTCSLFACNKHNGKSLSFNDYLAFQSKYIPARDVKVMLPAGYEAKKSYPVIYMHDGQMLFDSTSTWNKQEWGVDETVDHLIRANKIRPVIVVGISHTNNRSLEYMPNKPKDELKLIDRPDKFKGKILSDEYLKFLVEELKPFIDKTYRTQADRDNTFILGSSMGGLISCYAISEYPDVFGGAACLSTHWLAIDGVFLRYVEKNLPDPQTHKIYFDYGTKTLDSLYEPYQLIADSLMKERGYHRNMNWMTQKFEGAKHDENAWRDRLHIPLEFLLAKE
ncbi:alpha/beta hydrolase [Ancylomarina euxinus]|uniref:Alpha/beta hydrolase n=1 Tax=Ancylomarina euxinus TaxID=2283627 RepID=A0A425XXN5_9BACT|nr:alpha/beta hydrolase-fold protein [Ancylomarina euxinus]MCZ4694751.1 alpha/beta hydrolase-fold protein [Ancylomarina euxinus]MUP16415.1 esterase [Ancylomarina euxinus]RRG19442.1 alpha/beta hydrolase [Ancylomarina euxinus]